MNPDFAARHWFRLSALSVLLIPLSLVFRGLVAIRRALYRFGALPSLRLPVQVIVVGNLTVGGTGKTPLVIELVRQLSKLGRAPGIVSRGYGGTNQERAAPCAVLVGSDPAEVGDEALLLAERCGCPVWVGSDRAAAAAALLASHACCDLIVCDDGLQHYRLQRDVEIAVEDERGHGNGLMLPAGPLREPGSRQVDARVVNSEGTGKPSPRGARTYRMRLAPAGIYRLAAPAAEIAVGQLARWRIHAVAGIGNPDRFFATLRALGLEFTAHRYPDHHRYAPDDLRFPDCDLVVMTEKDAVKCRGFKRDDLAVLRVEAELDADFCDFLRTAIHGHAPA